MKVKHHQTSYITNAKVTSLDRKHKRRKRPTENKDKTIKKMMRGSYMLIIILNVHGLNAPTTKHSLAGWIQKQDLHMLSTRDSSLTFGHLQTENKGMRWHPTPVFLPGKSHGWRSLVGCSPWDREESDTTERLHFHFSLSCIGEGNGNPLQCSCLEPGGLLSMGSHRVRHD